MDKKENNTIEAIVVSYMSFHSRDLPSAFCRTEGAQPLHTEDRAELHDRYGNFRLVYSHTQVLFLKSNRLGYG